MITMNARKAAFKNRQSISPDTVCGCYFCLRTFVGADIVEWADLDEQTALCPNCGIDSVWPGVTEDAMLAEANEQWFSGEDK